MPHVIEKILAIDPGREKVGVAVAQRVGGEVGVAWCEVWPRAQFHARLEALVEKGEAFAAVALGDATAAGEIALLLRELLPGVPVTLVDERNSTLEARGEYWSANPPQGWRRLVPLSLQNPPRPVDDFAAVVLARRFFNHRPPTL